MVTDNVAKIQWLETENLYRLLWFVYVTSQDISDPEFLWLISMNYKKAGDFQFCH